MSNELITFYYDGDACVMLEDQADKLKIRDGQRLKRHEWRRMLQQIGKHNSAKLEQDED